jgi:hypothetical protein
MPELKNVFIAQVIRIENSDREINLDGECAKTLVQTVHLRVKEQLVGDVGSEVVLLAGDLNGYYFKTGLVYLVYPERLPGGTLRVSGYGQTKLLSDAKDDVAYIRSYGQRPSGGEVFGAAFAAADAKVATWMVAWPVKPMTGLKVTLQGDTRYEAAVGKDGKYKVSDMLPGRYVVSIDKKSAVWPSASQTVDVADKSCAEVNFNVDPFRTPDGALIAPKP